MKSSPISSQALPPGTRIEEFIIERILGSGGFGITYLATDTALGRQVVIKENLPVQFCFRDPSSLTVAPRHTTGEDAENFKWSLENFAKESAMLASLDHPGIVRVHRSFQAFGTAYFVMPYVEGVALDELTKERAGKPFSEAELHGLLERVLDALGYLHDRGIYHRDIKPGNILMTTDGIPVLIDFGSARQRLSERSMTVVESAGYTPFEQLQSRGNVGPWSDLYALGGTLVRVITGKTPPKAMDRMRKDPFLPMAERAEYETKLSRRFCQSIDQALSVDEEKRWQDAREWLAALRKNALVVTPQVFQAAPVSSPVNIAPTAARASNQATHRPGEERDFDLVKGCKIRMCWIPPGEFWMGSSTGQTGHHKDENQHRVRISKGFWLAQTQTTQAQWQAVMGNNPSHFKGQDLPVETVSWSDIVSPSGFIEKVNRHSGTPDQFSLPTEAQWEYACRSGKTGAYAGNLDQMAWYEKNSGMKTHPVAGKSANAWGLYDMHGNVWEWCSDWYGAYSDSAATDPKGSISGALRVFRGGGWYGCAEDCRVAYRGGNGSTFSNNGIGFRVARSSVP